MTDISSIIGPFTGAGKKINRMIHDLIPMNWFYQRWGIYTRNGSLVVTADSVLSFEVKRDWSLADYPLERGAFESYNKVQHPFDVRIRFAAGGTYDARQSLLESIEAVAGDLRVYSAVTPEKTYPSVNIVHFDYRRTSSSGVGLMQVDVWLNEVRNTVNTEFSGSVVSDPESADPTSGGQVQSYDINPNSVPIGLVTSLQGANVPWFQTG